eukprot:6960878-Ditylum_brightwellii.AAC.1
MKDSEEVQLNGGEIFIDESGSISSSGGDGDSETHGEAPMEQAPITHDTQEKTTFQTDVATK